MNVDRPANTFRTNLVPIFTKGCYLQLRMTKEAHIVFFDGVCNLCDATVQRIIARDPEGVFKFAPLQGETARRVLTDPAGTNSVVLLKNHIQYTRSDALIEILRELPRRGVLFHLLRATARPIRDFFYTRVARNRYRVWGRKEHCMVPSPEILNRFLN